MGYPERTMKWPDEFDDGKSFIQYCEQVAMYLYNLVMQNQKWDEWDVLDNDN